jgi:hypothetical protein
MLIFAYKNRKAIDNFTGDRRNDLWQFELKEDEWKIVKQLCDILEVCSRFHGFFVIDSTTVA